MPQPLGAFSVRNLCRRRPIRVLFTEASAPPPHVSSAGSMAAKVPVIDQREANTMSLAVLKRLDPQIEEVG